MTDKAAKPLPNGVMLNVYPDSIGKTLSDTVDMLKRPEFDQAFSLIYVLPTFFHSDLDRGFSVVDYDINEELVTPEDLAELDKLDIVLKLDLVLNHLSVGCPMFQDMLKNGDDSPFKDFFINWNEFWEGNGEMGPDGYIIPKEEHLNQLFMRKPGLPILMVRFPDGSERPYWNTFYQLITYHELTAEDLAGIEGLAADQVDAVLGVVNEAIRNEADHNAVDLGANNGAKEAVLAVVESKRTYTGQMDVNAKFEGTWKFYDETLGKLASFGCKLLRLDAFAYLHKEPGMTNFFNKPGTWDYLERLRRLAEKHGLTLLPEIHSEYGFGLHEEVSGEGYPIYDFFFPGLAIDSIDRGVSSALKRWISEIQQLRIRTINMLGCHDGIPVLDLKGKAVHGVSKAGLMTDEELDAAIDRVLERGGRVKNLYGPDGKKISYYQVNATFYSALGEDDQKLLMARALQLFMPGIPQVWYLDLFAGKNNYAAADGGGAAGHKEINRTTLTNEEIAAGMSQPIVLDQLKLLKLRNTHPAFSGTLTVADTEEHLMQMTWTNGAATATLKADLKSHAIRIEHNDGAGAEGVISFER